MIKNKLDLEKYIKNIKETKKSPKTQIVVSLGTCGRAAGGMAVYEKLQELIEAENISDITIKKTGCMGLCHSEPTVEVISSDSKKRIIYGNIKPDNVKTILTVREAGASTLTAVPKEWYYPETEDNTDNSPQARIVLKNSGNIDPASLDEYFMNDGYIALAKAITDMTPQNVIDEVKDATLRGRGGGGFITGVKWGLAAKEKNTEKFVICNADEGDPGAFMDRAVLEGDPFAVLESMTIAGYAIGADTGIIYIRAEYPLAIATLIDAIKKAKEKGFLGNNILSTNFSFNIELKYGAGAFVCGEETSLIKSIEGERGEPTNKPPYPAVEGLWSKPTIVNNVETYANVAPIIRKGADWFKKIGTKGSPGTKVFALAGKINKVGLAEVPMGTTLRDIIFKIGDGIPNNKEFKAVQTGGPSGGCIKSDKLDLGIDYDTLKEIGSMMGSGGMIILDEDDCMVSIAKFFLGFTLDESCGKCTPCRIGNKRLHEMLTKICEGTATPLTLKKLKNLSEVIKITSLCGLGQSSPNPVLSTMDQFEDEYLAHVNDKTCPAGACKGLLTYNINNKCIGCTLCAKKCPVNCISGEKKEKHTINQDECIKCGVCYDVCNFGAINKK
jgi:NADH:ubiquinone oxidoreductase subunit F (NADH-binding)/(2Fe-2S) ferredoxin